MLNSYPLPSTVKVKLTARMWRNLRTCMLNTEDWTRNRNERGTENWPFEYEQFSYKKESFLNTSVQCALNFSKNKFWILTPSPTTIKLLRIGKRFCFKKILGEMLKGRIPHLFLKMQTLDMSHLSQKAKMGSLPVECFLTKLENVEIPDVL